MSHRFPTKTLLLGVVASLIAAPQLSFSATVDLRPRVESRWTASVQTGSGSVILDGDIYFGFTDRPFPQSDFEFRGYATFDIGELPANACISEVRLDVDCIAPSLPGQSMGILHLTDYPVPDDANTILNSIVAAPVYVWIHNATITTGPHSFVLPRQAEIDLGIAAQGTGLRWFALAFMEAGMDHPTSMIKGWVHEQPVLHVTYTLPPGIAPTVTIAVDSVCLSEPFTVSWNLIPDPDITGYQIRWVGGMWQNVGLTQTSVQSLGAQGDFSFVVRAISPCGIGPKSEAAPIKIVSSPLPPDSVFAINSAICVNSNYTVRWDAVTGIQSYEIREDQGSWINVGLATQHAFRHSSAGVHGYKVRCINMCGSGPPRLSSLITVLDGPATSPALATSNSSPCPTQNFTISWPAVPLAIQYLLTDSVKGVRVNVGSDTEWTESNPRGTYRFWLQVLNACGWSSPSGPLSVKTRSIVAAPSAPQSDKNPAPVGEPFTLSWQAVPDATEYELWENGISLVSRDNSLSKTLTRNQAGDYTFSLKAFGACGRSAMGPELNLRVGNTTDIDETDAGVLPNSFVLNQNYPNPFNPTTVIAYSLPVKAHVLISIHNVLGQSIRVFDRGQQSAGEHSVTWDATDEHGKPVTSGLYFYKITAGAFVASRKMILLK